MEEGTKYNIPLDSELDINSHDMLVPVTQPKLLYNRQRFLGSLLTSSVRYEHEGWMAGWWAHEFNTRAVGNNSIEPLVEDFKILPFILESSKAYKIQINKKLYTVIFKDYLKVFDGKDIKVQTTADRLKSTVTGKTTKGNDFKLVIDPYTGDVSEEQLPVDFVKRIRLVGYNVFIEIVPDSSKNYLKLIKEKNTDLEYSLKDGTHKWGAFFELTGTDLKRISEELTIQSYDIKDSYIDVVAKNNNTGTQKMTFFYKDFWTLLTFDGVQFKYNKKQFGHLNRIERVENNMTTSYIKWPDKELGKDKDCSVYVTIPIYFRVYWEHKHTITPQEVTIEVPEFLLKRTFTEYVSYAAFKDAFLSLMAVKENSELGATWNFRMTYDIVDKSRNELPYIEKKPGYEADPKWCPIIVDKSVKLNKKKTFGTKLKYVPNLSFNFYKQPSQDNKPYVLNPNYDPNGTEDINLGWKVIYKEPPLIANLKFDYKKCNHNKEGFTVTRKQFGYKDEYLANPDFNFSLPVSATNPIKFKNPNYEQRVPWLLNPNYDHNKPFTFGTTDEYILNRNLDWNKDVNAALNPATILNPDFGKTPEVQPNVPFLINPAFGEICWGHNETVVNYEWFKTESGPLTIPNPYKDIGHMLPFDINPDWQEDYTLPSPLGFCWYKKDRMYSNSGKYNVKEFEWYFSFGDREQYIVNMTDTAETTMLNPNYRHIPKKPDGDEVTNPNNPKYNEWQKYKQELENYENMLKKLKPPKLPWQVAEAYPTDLKKIVGIKGEDDMVNIDYIPNYINKTGSHVAEGNPCEAKLYNHEFLGGMITTENITCNLYCYNASIDGLPVAKGNNYTALVYGLSAKWYELRDVLSQYYNGSVVPRLELRYSASYRESDNWKFIKGQKLYKVIGDGWYAPMIPMCATGAVYKHIKTIDIYKTELDSFEYIDVQWLNMEWWDLTWLELASMKALSVDTEDNIITLMVEGGKFIFAEPIKKDPNSNGQGFVELNTHVYPEWVKTDKFASTNVGMSIVKLTETSVQLDLYLKTKKAKCIDSVDIGTKLKFKYPESVFSKGKFKYYYIDDCVLNLTLNSKIDFKQLEQTIVHDDFTITFKPDGKALTATTKNSSISIEGSSLNSRDIVQSIIDLHNITLYKNFITEKVGVCSDLEITAYEKKQITFSNKKEKELTINISSEAAVKSKEILLDKAEQYGTYTQYFISEYNIAKFEFKPKGVLSAKVQQSVGSNTVTVLIDGKTYTITIDENSSIFIDYITTDIRTNAVKKIYERSALSINMYLKQFWSNDKTTEYYWWYDKNTVIELTPSEFVVHTKTDAIDDWMGDKWEKNLIIPREKIIDNRDFYYNMSGANGTTPVFFKLQMSDDLQSLVILYRLGPEFGADNKVTVPINNLKLNEGGNDGKSLCTYNNLNMNNIAKDSKISSVVIGNKLLIGVAYTRGLDQWTIVVDINSKEHTVFWGYGNVGINGVITGGQLPSIVLDKYGFKETIWTIDQLKNKTELKQGCYGTGKSVSFIYATVDKICTHCAFINGTISPQYMQLNNNYITKYSNVSFYYNSEYNNKEKSLTDNMTTEYVSSGAVAWWNKIVNAPKKAITDYNTNMCYRYIQFLLVPFINHSCGSYAYVWKNSTMAGKSLSDTVVYCKDHIVKINRDPIALTWYYKMMTASLENQGEVAKQVEYKPNSLSNKIDTSNDNSSISNSLFYKANLDSVTGSNIQGSGLLVSMASTICEFATLDMFYNVNDKIQCWAGPGFVQHNFVGICAAQSVTDLQCDIKHMDYLINFIESVIAGLKYSLTQAEIAYRCLKDIAEVNKPLDIKVLGTGLTVGVAIALGIIIPATITLGIIVPIVTLAIAFCEAIIKMFSLEKTRAHIQGTLIKYKLDIEGKHYYGQRSLSIMYPVFGLDGKAVPYTDEAVEAEKSLKTQELIIDSQHLVNITDELLPIQTTEPIAFSVKKPVLTMTNVKCRGRQSKITGPADMAIVEGTQSFLNQELFIDEQVGVSNPVFNQPIVHDYMLDKKWKLGVTAAAGEIISVSQDDTKLIDGAPSNIVITSDFCGIATSYTAIEVKDYYDERYLRPVALTPTAIGLNINRVNCVHESRPYHAFDGYGNRIVSWKGDIGMDKEFNFQQYAFQQNDHFKRSNIFPPSQFMGSFVQKPTLAIDSEDQVINNIQNNANEIGIVNDTPGEQKNLTRFAIPVHSEPMSSLPAMVRMLQPYKLHVVEGVTSLCTDIRSMQLAYKAPTSIDFNINGEPFRATEEFISQITEKAGIVAVQDVVATEGLRFVGATTEVAYFYSPATRMYYSFTGSRTITKNDIIYRFKDLKEGKWDFVNQEVLLKVLLADDAGKVLIVRLDNLMKGELYPPTPTLYDNESDFKTLSMPAGFVYQGPKRFSVNRFVITENMFEDVKGNKKKWTRLDRQNFYGERDYHWEYQDLTTQPITEAVKGWTHNPFKLATAMLGVNEETDCKFEWSVTFAWTFALEKLYEQNEYVTVCLQGETVTEGGTVLGEVTHVPLYKECFTRAGDAGYFTFQFQSGNGIGNRERLYIWCDGIIAVESIQLECKNITTRRTQPLYTQVDVQDLIEQ